MNDRTVQTMFGSHPVPTLNKTNFGGLLLTMQHPLRVSITIHLSEFRRGARVGGAKTRK